MKKQTLFLFLALIGFTPGLFAYTDQITVKAPEAWVAAQEVLKPHGIKKMDEKNLTLETNWVVDRVLRSRGVLKGFFNQTYDRRYRIIVKITQRDYDSEIDVRGVFQERPVENNQHLILWRKYKVESADYDVERHVFMQILNRLELSRNHA